MVRKQGQRGTSKDATERRERLLNQIRLYGNWSLNVNAWAEQEGVSRITIYDDLRWLRENVIMNTIDEEEIKFELDSGLKNLLVQARKHALTNESLEERRKWTVIYSQLTERFTRFLEDFGAKKGQSALEVEGITVLTAEDMRKKYEETQ